MTSIFCVSTVDPSDLILCWGQGHRSHLISLPTQNVETFPLRTKCFRFLHPISWFDITCLSFCMYPHDYTVLYEMFCLSLGSCHSVIGKGAVCLWWMVAFFLVPHLHTYKILVPSSPTGKKSGCPCCSGYDTCFSVKACDGLCQLLKSTGSGWDIVKSFNWSCGPMSDTLQAGAWLFPHSRKWPDYVGKFLNKLTHVA